MHINRNAKYKNENMEEKILKKISDMKMRNALFFFLTVGAAAVGTVLGPGIQPILADTSYAVTEDISGNLVG